jgi:Flp pilus assembly protein CpaB
MRRKARSFFSAKPAGRFREVIPLALGGILAGIALAAASSRIAAVEKEIHDRSNPVEVVVASTPIAPGEAFSEGNLAKKSIPASGAGVRNVPAAEFELLLGGRSRNPVDPGEPVLWTDVEEPYDTKPFSLGIAQGRRAMTLVVDATSSFAGLLHPGDRVDLLCEPDGKGIGGAPWWVRDIPVAAVDRNHGRLGKPADSPDAATVTLLVTPAEGLRIATSAGSGKIHWFLRNPEDNTVAIPAAGRGPISHLAVEIWKAGLPESRHSVRKDAAE